MVKMTLEERWLALGDSHGDMQPIIEMAKNVAVGKSLSFAKAMHVALTYHEDISAFFIRVAALDEAREHDKRVQAAFSDVASNLGWVESKRP